MLNVEVGKNRLRKSELERVEEKLWNHRLVKVVAKLEKIFYYDRLYIGGENAGLWIFWSPAGNVTIVSNPNGLLAHRPMARRPRCRCPCSRHQIGLKIVNPFSRIIQLTLTAGGAGHCGWLFHHLSSSLPWTGEGGAVASTAVKGSRIS